MSLYRLVGIVGHAGSGKDTVADMLGWRRMSFAEPMKRFCMEVFDWSEEQVFGPSAERSKPDSRYTREDGEQLTPRFALQTLGTEWGRKCCPDIWVRYCVRKAVALQVPVVITDCRFVNEAKAIRSAGGEVWRVFRPGAALAGAAGQHVSEQEQDSEEMDSLISLTMQNTGTLDDLRDMVQLAVTKRHPTGREVLVTRE